MALRNWLGTLLVVLVCAIIGAVVAGIIVWEPWDGGGSGGGDDLAEKPAGSTSTPKVDSDPLSIPTPRETELTGPEAAALVAEERHSQLMDELVEQSRQTPAADVIVVQDVEKCRSTEFDEELLAWIVECDITREVLTAEGRVSEPERTLSETFRLYDATAELEPCC